MKAEAPDGGLRVSRYESIRLQHGVGLSWHATAMLVRLNDLPAQRAKQLLVPSPHLSLFRPLVQLIHNLRECDTYPEFCGGGI
jgi:hypothetical protein